MAKKDLASLMSGIMGTPSQQDKATISDTTNSTDNYHDALDQAQSDSPTRRKPGRPRKAQSSDTPDEIRATFIVNPELMRKLKYISLVENMMQKDIVRDALTSYIEGWEAQNGPINLPDR